MGWSTDVLSRVPESAMACPRTSMEAKFSATTSRAARWASAVAVVAMIAVTAPGTMPEAKQCRRS